MKFLQLDHTLKKLLSFCGPSSLTLQSIVIINQNELQSVMDNLASGALKLMILSKNGSKCKFIPLSILPQISFCQDSDQAL